MSNLRKIATSVGIQVLRKNRSIVLCWHHKRLHSRRLAVQWMSHNTFQLCVWALGGTSGDRNPKIWIHVVFWGGLVFALRVAPGRGQHCRCQSYRRRNLKKALCGWVQREEQNSTLGSSGVLRAAWVSDTTVLLKLYYKKAHEIRDWWESLCYLPRLS